MSDSWIGALSEASKIYWQSQEKAAVTFKHASNLDETLPIENAPRLTLRVMDGKARFRMVLVNGNG